MTAKEYDEYVGRQKRKQETAEFAPQLLRLPLTILMIIAVIAFVF